MRSTNPTSDTGDSAKMDPTDAETRKRTLLETTGDDDDEPAEKYWRAEDFVDELTGNWLIDENEIFDNNAAEDTWADRLGASGELDRQAEDEATEKLLDSLLAHGVVEDMKREDATKVKPDDSMGQTMEDEER